MDTMRTFIVGVAIAVGIFLVFLLALFILSPKDAQPGKDESAYAPAFYSTDPLLRIGLR
jgi:hypothetical protein